MRYSASNVTTAVMLVLTVGTIWWRYRSRPDSNWPLFYFLFIVMFHQAFPGLLNDWAIYTGVVSALFLRFEFMGGFIRWLFLFAETGSMMVTAYILFNLIWG